jgi:hypothetical protein
MPVYCAVNMDLNPVAFDPSANIPFIPYTDLNVHEKIYGDADETLSDSTITVASTISADPGSGSDGTAGEINVNSVH